VVNTYQHISFAQLVYFSYVCGEAWLATNTYQMRPIFCSAEIYLWSPLCLENIRPLLSCCFFKLTLFPSILLCQVGVLDGCASKPRHLLAHFWIRKGCQSERDQMAGGGWFSETGGNHVTGSRIQWQHISLDCPSLLPRRSLRRESRWSCPRGETHQTGLTHESGVQGCVRCCCCRVCR